jgi:hypothetical protein
MYSGLILATVFSGLIAAGVFAGLDSYHGLAGWKWLFLIEGAGSFPVALLAFTLLPDYPGNRTGVCKWLLTEDEENLTVQRMINDRVSLPRENSGVWNGLKLAVLDSRTWIYVSLLPPRAIQHPWASVTNIHYFDTTAKAIILMANHSAYGFNNFFSTIVSGFDLGNTTMTLLLTAPPYLVATVSAFIGSWSSDRQQERGFHISVLLGVAAVGFMLSTVTVHSSARYASAFLYVSGCFTSNSLVFGWASSTLAQTSEKRAAAMAIINLFGQLGNIYSPCFFPSADAPRYAVANMLMMSFSLLSIVMCMVLKLLLRRANQQLLEAGDNRTLYVL